MYSAPREIRRICRYGRYIVEFRKARIATNWKVGRDAWGDVVNRKSHLSINRVAAHSVHVRLSRIY